MRILFASGAPCYPFAYDGGAQRAQQELVTRLADQGWHVQVVCGLPGDDLEQALGNAARLGVVAQRMDAGSPQAESYVRGCQRPFVACRSPAVLTLGMANVDCEAAWRQRVQQGRPDLVVTWLRGSGRALQIAQAADVPALLRVFDPVNWVEQPRCLGPRTVVVANSPVTAQAAGYRFGRPVPFLLEPVDHDAYRVHRRPGPCVTFINPVGVKGLALFHAIARQLTDIPMLVVRGWSWASTCVEDEMLRRSLAGMPHVRIEGPFGDMRGVYERTKILLVPSRWPEAWGRVACEAQASGIPVLASNRGSLPQNVGAGGAILEYGDPALWADAVRALYDDARLYNQLSAAALENVARFPFDALIDQYAQLLAQVARGQPPVIPRVDRYVTIRRVRRRDPGVELVLEEIDIDQPADLAPPPYP